MTQYASVLSDAAGQQNVQPPALSVILCINRPNPWWQAAFASVLAQDDPDFEFLIAANACTDEFWDSLQAMAQGDVRVRLFRTAIGQLSFNLNVLADQARGDYLVRMDADDISATQRIATLRKRLEKSPVDILGSAVLLIDEGDQVIGRMNFPLAHADIVRALKRRTVFCHPAVAIRRQFLLDMRGYLGGYHSEDTDLWLRARRAGASMENLPDALLSYRIHAQQSTSTRTGYAEVCGHWLREFLLHPSLYTLEGLSIAVAKALLKRILPGSRRYRTRQEVR